MIIDTQGALYDDNSNFIVYKSVAKAFKSIKLDEIFNYPKLQGSDEFCELSSK
jgi:hypothetical protein